MKRHIISKFQGTIVVLTVLIAVTLGMTNPSIVLAAKAQYVVNLELSCGTSSLPPYPSTKAVAEFYFYLEGGEIIGGATVVCEPSGGEGGDTVTGTTGPMRAKPLYWVGSLSLQDPSLNSKMGAIYCYTYMGNYFPVFGGATENLICISPVDDEVHNAVLTIFDPTRY